jgi:SAM-dependent methyltransferase
MPPRFSYCFLNVCGSVVLWLARWIGVTYTKLWAIFGVPWFDHRFDWLLGPENWVWNERGIYGVKTIRPGDKILDICCGDGIYAGLYYSKVAGLVHAIDRSDKGVRLAKKRYSHPKVNFFNIDVTKEDFPSDNYDVVFMFAAIEHLSQGQGTQILQRIAKVLSASSNGSFLGSTPIILEQARGHGHPEHKNEFTSLEQLQDFLSPHFADIEFWSSKWGLAGERKDMYFLCRKPIAPNTEIALNWH